MMEIHSGHMLAVPDIVPGLVSTIIPVYNRARMVEEATRSVLAQTYRPIEILIVDDGSTDETPRVIATLAARHEEIRVLTRPNGGPGAARETGRLEMRGEFVQLLDSDDLIDTTKFELQVSALRQHPECGVAYCKARLVLQDGSVDPKPSRRTGENIESMFPSMLALRWWETASPLYRASLMHEAGSWLSLRAEEDWEYDCRIAARGVKTCFVDEWLCSHRRHEANISGSFNAVTLRDQSVAHAAMYQHARTARIDHASSEMRHFAREVFLLSRQCGQMGLTHESASLFALAQEASGTERGRLPLRVYGSLARLVGWTAAGKIAAAMDRMR
jgi:glycosyltransferase involved in cell wall biosynthesis